jgi:hypothetical protein
MKYLIILSLLVCMGLCITLAAQESMPHVTPYDLNSSKENFDGKLVVVSGFLINQNESSSIWDSRFNLDKEGAAGKHCVSILYPSSMEKELDKLDGQHVYVTGVFDKNISRDGRIYMGLCNLTAIKLNSLPRIIIQN